MWKADGCSLYFIEMSIQSRSNGAAVPRAKTTLCDTSAHFTLTGTPQRRHNNNISKTFSAAPRERACGGGKEDIKRSGALNTKTLLPSDVTLNSLAAPQTTHFLAVAAGPHANAPPRHPFFAGALAGSRLSLMVLGAARLCCASNLGTNARVMLTTAPGGFCSAAPFFPLLLGVKRSRV